MAVTSIRPVKVSAGAALSYIIDGDKTVNGLYVQSYACRSDSRGASEDFRRVREQGTGRSTTLAQHIIQSFAPSEVTPEQALAIGNELCERYLKDQYQYVLAVHTDHQHIHCHIVFNNTNLYTHRTFETEENQGGKSVRAWAKLRAISDEICKEHGISVIEQPQAKGKNHFEWEMEKEGKSWKAKLRQVLRELISYSKSFEDFLQNCDKSGIEYVYTPSNKVKLKFRLKDEGQQRFTRADTLGAEFEPEAITATIEAEQKHRTAKEQVEKFLAARRARREAEIAALAPKPVEPKPSAPTQTAQTKPIESKPTEKKEDPDPWSAIRGMGKSDEIISALEAVGITSFSEFSTFMHKTTHKDDHTDEVADLKSHINTVKSSISKMKRRDELKPVYKEYQSKSGWAQSRFKKKNADMIEEYEQAIAFIKEHSTKYTSDGSIPSIEDMEGLLKRMIDRRDEILPEHNAFLAKKKVALKYTQAVRHYRNEQTNKKAAEQSRQRKLDQQKKKNVLE